MKIFNWEWRSATQMQLDELRKRVREIEDKTQDFGGSNRYGFSINRIYAETMTNMFCESKEKTKLTLREVVQKIMDHVGLEIKRESACIEVVKRAAKKKEHGQHTDYYFAGIRVCNNVAGLDKGG